MKGKNTFCKSTANNIEMRLIELRLAPEQEQKKIRRSLRNKAIGFYITDFDETYSGFTADDFQQKIKEGKITVLPDQ